MKKQLTIQEIATKKKTDFAQQITAWKKQHGKVRMQIIGEGEEAKVIFFRLPSRPELSSSQKVSLDEEGKTDVYRKADQIMTDCLLGGELTPAEIAADASIYLPVARFVLYDLIEEKKNYSEDC